MSTEITPNQLIIRYARRCWREVAIIILLTTIASALAMVGPALVAGTLTALHIGGQQNAANATTPFDLDVLGERVLTLWPFRHYTDSVSLIIVLGLAYLGQAMVAALVQLAAAWVAVRIRTQTQRMLQNDLTGHLLGLSLRFFNQSKSGELVSRLMYDVQNASSSVGPAIQGILQYSLQVIGYSLYLLSTSGWLTLGALLVVGSHFGINRLLKNPIRRLGQKTQNTQARLAATFQEMFTSIRVVKSFGAESVAADRIRQEADLFTAARRSQGQVESIADPARGVVDALAIVAVLIIAALEVRRGTIAPQGLVLFVFVARVVIQPANLLATSYLRLVATSASLIRVAQLMNQRPQVVDGEIDKSAFARALEVKEVSFAYADAPVLTDVTLTVNRGEIIALVGRSGSGKSTLTDLILRLYDPTAGAVLIDGIDIRQVKQTPYRRLFGVVSQETLLLHDTVRNNIRFGRAEITDDRVRIAAQLARAHGFIERLPHGYDTVVGDRGVGLSGGERQRIAIARAIVHRPEILIFDEATSALDSESEHEVQLAVDELLKQSTAIMIAHRLSTVLHADKIVFMDSGRIAAVGTHRDLFERCPPYRRLCELQFLDSSRAQVVET